MTMDLELKYTEDKFQYEIDEYFFFFLDVFTLDEASMMVGQVLAIITELPDKKGWSQEVAGVLKSYTHNKEPLFFKIEYLKEQGHIPILVDINEIEVDEYLDFIIDNKSIKSYVNEQRIKDLICERGALLSPKGDS